MEGLLDLFVDEQLFMCKFVCECVCMYSRFSMLYGTYDLLVVLCGGEIWVPCDHLFTVKYAREQGLGWAQCVRFGGGV